MSELELEATSYQVEVVGEPSPLGKKLIVDGYDLSSMTREVSVRVPANGIPTVEITVIPHRLLAKLDIPIEGMRLWVEGIGSLLSHASHAEEVVRKAGYNGIADNLREAINRVESGLDG
jgi:hypothetical protein